MRPSAVQSLVRESQVVRENKEKQIAELKKMAEQSADSLKNEWEKKVMKHSTWRLSEREGTTPEHRGPKIDVSSSTIATKNTTSVRFHTS